MDSPGAANSMPPTSSKRRIKNAHDEVYETMEGAKDLFPELFSQLFNTIVKAHHEGRRLLVGSITTGSFMGAGTFPVFLVRPITAIGPEEQFLRHVIGPARMRRYEDFENASVLVYLVDGTAPPPPNHAPGRRFVFTWVPIFLVGNRGLWVFASAWKSKLLHHLGDGGLLTDVPTWHFPPVVWQAMLDYFHGYHAIWRCISVSAGEKYKYTIASKSDPVFGFDTRFIAHNDSTPRVDQNARLYISSEYCEFESNAFGVASPPPPQISDQLIAVDGNSNPRSARPALSAEAPAKRVRIKPAAAAGLADPEMLPEAVTFQAIADAAFYNNSGWRYASPRPEYSFASRINRHPALRDEDWSKIGLVSEMTAAFAQSSVENVSLLYDNGLFDNAAVYATVFELVRKERSLSSDQVLDALRIAFENALAANQVTALVVAAILQIDPFEMHDFNSAAQYVVVVRELVRMLLLDLSVFPAKKALAYLMFRLAGVEMGADSNSGVVYSSPEEKRFYDMKAGQDAENLEVDVFYVKEGAKCPIWDKYSHAVLIGTGGFGFTIRYTRRVESATLGYHEYVAKFQLLSDTSVLHSVPYVELRCLYEVNQLAVKWSRERLAQPFNHVHLYDWVRCRFNAVQRVADFLPEAERNKLGNLAPNSERIYQIIVEEFATGGSLGKVLTSNETAFERYATPESFASLVAQVFGFLGVVGDLADFTHCDLKPDNILIAPADAATNISTLVYELPLNLGVLYVPITDSRLAIFKVADYGLSQMNAWRVDATNAEEIALKGAVSTHGVAEVQWIPGVDIVCFIAMFINAAITVLRTVDYRLRLHPDVLDFLVQNMRESTPREIEAHKRFSEEHIGYAGIKPGVTSASYVSSARRIEDDEFYALVVNRRFVLDSLTGKLDRRTTIKELKDAAYNLYYYTAKFLPINYEPAVDGTDAYVRLMNHRLIGRYKSKPNGFSPMTALAMTDYNVTAVESGPAKAAP